MNTCDTNTDKTANRHTLITKLCLCKLQVNIVLYWRFAATTAETRAPAQPAGSTPRRDGLTGVCFCF